MVTMIRLLNDISDDDDDYNGDNADLQIDGAPAPMAHQITLWAQL